MKLDFEELSADVVEEWKYHPGTQVLMKQLIAARAHWSGRLELDASSAAKSTKVASHGGRCVQLRQVIDDIKDAKGKKSE